VIGHDGCGTRSIKGAPLEYLIFGFGFIVFLPFAIWAVSTGVQHSRFERTRLEKRGLEVEK
jgi:hypothetical protein